MNRFLNILSYGFITVALLVQQNLDNLELLVNSNRIVGLVCFYSMVMVLWNIVMLIIEDYRDEEPVDYEILREYYMLDHEPAHPDLQKMVYTLVSERGIHPDTVAVEGGKFTEFVRNNTVGHKPTFPC